MNKTDKLNEIREQAIETIKKALKKHNINFLHVTEMDVTDIPVVRENPEDEEDTYTLDAIELNGENLTFNASSSWDNGYFKPREIDIELLVYIADWAEEYDEAIAKYAAHNGTI